MSGNAKALASLAKFSAGLSRLPTVVAQKVAAEVAPVLTELVNQTFDSSEDAFGGSWRIRADGNRTTLKQSGALAKNVKYVAIGTKLRLALGVRYARYQIGIRPIAPKQGEGLPIEYSRAMERVTAEVIRRELGVQ